MAPPFQLNPRAASFVPGASAPAVSSSGLNTGASSFGTANPVFPNTMYPPGVAVGVGLNTGISGRDSGAVGGGTETDTGVVTNGDMVNGDGEMVNGVNGYGGHDENGGNATGTTATFDPFSSQLFTIDTARNAQPQNLGRFSTFDDYLSAQRQAPFHQNVGFTAAYLAERPYDPYANAGYTSAYCPYCGRGGNGGYRANHVLLPLEHFALPPEVERGRTMFRSGGGSWRRKYRGRKGQKKGPGSDEDA